VLDELKRRVYDQNVELLRRGLVIDTWGNASGVDRTSGRIVIKPSGVPYESMRPSDMVVVDLRTGEVIDGAYKPSSDTATHMEIYRAFPTVGGVVHTHSLYATAWAQAGRDIPALGTTHADYFFGDIPCTRPMRAEEIQGDYEASTGTVIVERMVGMDPLEMPAILVANHGPFAWGASVEKAVNNASIMEHLAHLAIQTLQISPKTGAINPVLLDKHFHRKHGPGSYYGQKRATEE
jgi:L-ribulose-5-phosphate 4-epimerase